MKRRATFIAPHSTGEFVYHLAVLALLGIAALSSAAGFLHDVLTEPQPVTPEWVSIGDGCYRLTGPIVVHSCPGSGSDW